MNYRDIITMEPGKRGGKPCIRGLRITVYDILEMLASGMTEAEILDDFDYLTHDDIMACLAYAPIESTVNLSHEAVVRRKPITQARVATQRCLFL